MDKLILDQLSRNNKAAAGITTNSNQIEMLRRLRNVQGYSDLCYIHLEEGSCNKKERAKKLPREEDRAIERPTILELVNNLDWYIAELLSQWGIDCERVRQMAAQTQHNVPSLVGGKRA